MDVFGLWEETEAPWGNPLRLRANTHTQKSRRRTGSNPEASSCEILLLFKKFLFQKWILFRSVLHANTWYTGLLILVHFCRTHVTGRILFNEGFYIVFNKKRSLSCATSIHRLFLSYCLEFFENSVTSLSIKRERKRAPYLHQIYFKHSANDLYFPAKSR